MRPQPPTQDFRFLEDWFCEHAHRQCSPKIVELYRQLAGYITSHIGVVKLQDLTALALGRIFNPRTFYAAIWAADQKRIQGSRITGNRGKRAYRLIPATRTTGDSLRMNGWLKNSTWRSPNLRSIAITFGIT